MNRFKFQQTRALLHLLLVVSSQNVSSIQDRLAVEQNLWKQQSKGTLFQVSCRQRPCHLASHWECRSHAETSHKDGHSSARFLCTFFSEQQTRSEWNNELFQHRIGSITDQVAVVEKQAVVLKHEAVQVGSPLYCSVVLLFTYCTLFIAIPFSFR